MARLTVATVKAQLEQKGLVLRISPGKGYSVYKKNEKQNLDVHFKNLQDLVAKYFPTKGIDPKKMLRVEGIKQSVTHANNLTKQDTEFLKKQIYKIFKDFDKQDITNVINQVFNLEMSNTDIDRVVDKTLPIKTERNRKYFLVDNLKAKELLKQLRENSLVDLAGQFFLSQV